MMDLMGVAFNLKKVVIGMMLMPSEHNSENKATVLIFLVDRYTS